MRNTIGALMVAVSAVAFAASANANEYTPYVGVDYGYNDVNYYNSAIVNVGTNFNKYFGTEVFYQFSDSKRDNEGNENSMRAYGLDAYGYLPLGCAQTFSLVGTAGIAELDYKIKNQDEKRYNDNGVGYRLGVGVQYAIDENVAVRAIARYTFTDKIDGLDHIMEYTAGVRYNF